MYNFCPISLYDDMFSRTFGEIVNKMVNRKLNQSRVQINIAMLSCQFGAFHFGAPKFDACQFGAFHFGAPKFDACQFGAFQFDAVPVRRVSLWRDASLARFTLAPFPFLCLPTLIQFLRSPVSRGLYFVFLQRRVVCVYLRACFLSAKKYFLRLFGAYLFLRARVAYLFALMFPFCEEVFSTPVLARISFCAYVDRVCEYGV